jgi:hypothetical protein
VRGVGVTEFRFPRRGLIAALALMGLVLGGCSQSSLPDSFGSLAKLAGTMPGSNANASAAAPGAPILPPDFECPPVQVRTGAATLTSSSNPAEPTALNMKYQVTIGTTARECRMGPNNMVQVRVGMQGRVILGPDGGNPGTINVPLRFAVVRETIDTKVITTQLDRITVTIPPNDSNVLFSHVSEGMEFPMPRGGDTDSYLIYIGFDPAAAEPEHKKPAPKSKPKTAKQAGPTG